MFNDHQEKTRDPQTRAVSPDDAELRGWLQRHLQSEADALRSRIDPGTGRMMDDVDDGGGGGTGGGTTGGGLAPAPPLTSFYAYRNYRPDVDWNTCGQAAIGTMLDFHRKDPFSLPRDSFGRWNDGQIIDAVIGAGFSPDVIFGWGTSPGRIRDALQHHGVGAQVGSSGLFFSGWQTQWNRLLAHVYYSALPVPVLVDMGLLGGSAFGAHWPILWKMTLGPVEMMVHLANWSSGWTSMPIPMSRFIEAWACRHLPLGFNHAAVYTGTPRVTF